MLHEGRSHLGRPSLPIRDSLIPPLRTQSIVTCFAACASGSQRPFSHPSPQGLYGAHLLRPSCQNREDRRECRWHFRLGPTQSGRCSGRPDHVLAPGEPLGLFEGIPARGTLETGRRGPREGPPRDSRASIGVGSIHLAAKGQWWHPPTGSAPVADQSGTSPRHGRRPWARSGTGRATHSVKMDGRARKGLGGGFRVGRRGKDWYPVATCARLRA